MRPIPPTEGIRAVARRVVWFEEPEQVLSAPVRFLAYAMTYASHEDMRAIREHVTDDDLREAFDKAHLASSIRARGLTGT